MQRRVLLATVGLVGTGGCLRLQSGNAGGDGASTPTAGTDDRGEETQTATDDDGTATAGQGGGVTLSEGWRSDESAEYVWNDGPTAFFVDGELAAAATADGGVQWVTEAPPPSGGTGNAVETFVADGERAIVGYSADTDTDEGAYFCAFDRTTGERLWTVAAPADGMHHAAEGVAIVDGTAVLAAADYGSSSDQTPVVYGVDAATGERAWTTTTPDVPAGFVSNVVGYGGSVHVVFGSEGARVLDPATGAVTGSRESMWTQMWTGAAREGTLYATWDGAVRAYDLETGEARWSSEGGGRGRIPPAVGADLVVAGTKTAFVTGFEVESGEQRWQARTDAPVVGVALSASHVWVTDEDGTLTCYRRGDGTMAGTWSLESDESDVAVVDATVVVGGESGVTAHRIE
jgi:outer membrane protein assembly factor BamB